MAIWIKCIYVQWIILSPFDRVTLEWKKYICSISYVLPLPHKCYSCLLSLKMCIRHISKCCVETHSVSLWLCNPKKMHWSYTVIMSVVCVTFLNDLCDIYLHIQFFAHQNLYPCFMCPKFTWQSNCPFDQNVKSLIYFILWFLWI